MSSIVVCGGGPIGLSTGLMLARDGHRVTVLEGDPAAPPPTPVDAWGSWERPGVAQFVQPHTVLGGFRAVCQEELPDVLDRLLAAGCVEVDVLSSLPPALQGTAPREGDERLRMLAGRRPVIEAALAAAAAEEPGLTVRRGVRVAGLLPAGTAGGGVPHVGGVRTESGEEVVADLVVDATGRRTPSERWLTDLGARPPETESSGRGFTYYTRYYRGTTRPRLRGPTNSPYGSFSVLQLEGDACTWSLTIFALSADRPLKAVRSPEVFDRVMRACPLQAPLTEGEPLTGVLPMAGPLNTLRRFVVDGRPIVTGFAAISDAWACTNPSGGRGLSVGLRHAQLLRSLLRDGIGGPAEFAAEWQRRTDDALTPFYRVQERTDRDRIAEMAALAAGTEPLPPDAELARFTSAAMHDPDVFRAMVETNLCLAPLEEVLARPLIRERVAALPSAQPLVLPGPDRGQLLDLLAA